MANADLNAKIKRYHGLIIERKDLLEKLAAEGNAPEDVHETSITRKLGHTDMGDISDTLELGSALNKSVEENYVSRANINVQNSMIAIKREDFDESTEFQNRDDISDRGNVGLSVSLMAGHINTAASVHLREAMHEMKVSGAVKGKSYRVLATRGEDEKNSNKIDAESVYGDHNVVVSNNFVQATANTNNSVLAASVIAVQKLPVSLLFEHSV